MISKGSLSALNLLERCGLNDPTEIPLHKIIFGLGAYYEERPLKKCEGRIFTWSNKTIITINSNISIEGKKRYALAHEIGHFEMHRDSIPIILDSELDFVDWLKHGPHEQEANEFAAEFLMPREIFRIECKNKKISPELIRYLASRFQTSLTSTVLRYVQFGNHEVCVVYCKDNKMKWWKKSEDFYPFLNFQFDDSPPSGSVAYEMFTKKTFYDDLDQKQQVWKSDWFKMKDDEIDTPFFEFCIFVPSYNYTLSIIWQENKKSKYSV
jgi:Zn-dependent peptidase ImmA (M78 family)